MSEIKLYSSLLLDGEKQTLAKLRKVGHFRLELRRCACPPHSSPSLLGWHPGLRVGCGESLVVSRGVPGLLLLDLPADTSPIASSFLGTRSVSAFCQPSAFFRSTVISLPLWGPKSRGMLCPLAVDLEKPWGCLRPTCSLGLLHTPCSSTLWCCLGAGLLPRGLAGSLG